MRIPLLSQFKRALAMQSPLIVMVGLVLLPSATHAQVPVTERPRNLPPRQYHSSELLKPGQMEAEVALSHAELEETYQRCVIRPKGNYQSALSQFLNGIYREPVAIELLEPKSGSDEYPDGSSWGMSYQCVVNATASRVTARCTPLVDRYPYVSVQLAARGEVPSTLIVARLPRYSVGVAKYFSTNPEHDEWGRKLETRPWMANVRFPAVEPLPVQGVVYNWERLVNTGYKFFFNLMDKTELSFPYAWTEQCLRYEFSEVQKGAQ